MFNHSGYRAKWLLAGLLALSAFAAARAALVEKLYLPITRRVYPATPTPTIVPGIYITGINFSPPSNPMDEYVIITNLLGDDQDLTGWLIRDDNKNSCIMSDHFPSRRYTLDEDRSVYVWTKAGVSEVNIGGIDNIYCGFTVPIWNDPGDRAYLRDEDNELIDDYAYGALNQAAAPLLETPPPPAAPPSPAPTPSPTLAAP